MSNESIAYFLLRLTLGFNFFMHGLGRIPHYSEFISKTVTQFQNTILPSTLVTGFAYSLPVVEGIIGLLLILGLFTRNTLIVGALWIMALIFGMTLRQEWNVVGLQMGYSVIFFILLFLLQYNQISLDRRLNKV
jgi:thiosulfate dehydrogenase (quinone) large subunit